MRTSVQIEILQYFQSLVPQPITRKAIGESRFIQEGNYCYHPQLHDQHEAFAKAWDKNLRSQGFAEVFTDKCIRG